MTIQNRDSEQLTAIETTQAQNLLNLMTQSKQSEIETAQETIASMNLTREKNNDRVQYLRNLVNGGTSGLSLFGHSKQMKKCAAGSTDAPLGK